MLSCEFKAHVFFFMTKNKIHSFKIMLHHHIIQNQNCLKQKKDESANKFTVASELIAYNDKMPTNIMKLLKCLKYPCF
jgi:hypothetical protein